MRIDDGLAMSILPHGLSPVQLDLDASKLFGSTCNHHAILTIFLLTHQRPRSKPVIHKLRTSCTPGGCNRDMQEQNRIEISTRTEQMEPYPLH